mmetsp:Transcript_13869/g.44388  ORF Transcript_13869/g.44388 Transcript_13869/m.44388 type:complete len:301 (-) Transcript_13869:643-1545(-)
MAWALKTSASAYALRALVARRARRARLTCACLRSFIWTCTGFATNVLVLRRAVCGTFPVFLACGALLAVFGRRARLFYRLVGEPSRSVRIRLIILILVLVLVAVAVVVMVVLKNCLRAEPLDHPFGVVNASYEAHVRELDMALGIEENVDWLEIAVQIVALVHVAQSEHQLRRHELDVLLWHPLVLVLLHEALKCPPAAELHHNNGILRGLQGIVHRGDERELAVHVHVALHHELLPAPLPRAAPPERLDELALGHDLEGILLARALLPDMNHGPERPLPEKAEILKVVNVDDIVRRVAL